LNRREFLRAGVLAGVGTLAAPMLNRGRFSLFADERIEHSARAIDLVARSTVIDMLSLLTLDWGKLDRWQRTPACFEAADFRRLRSSGIQVFHPAVDPDSPDPVAAAEGWMSRWNHLLAGRPDCFLRVDQAADLARAKQTSRIGLVLGFQSSDHFRSPEDVPRFHRLGQRVSQLTYNERNRLGSGCKDPFDRGLTEAGAQIVEAMNRVGMAVDVSHCSERTTLDAFGLSRRPVLITHANCRALNPNPRCKSDAVLRALAAEGGVMGITAVRAFVRPSGPVTVESWLDHFEHVARVAGIEHVGLGTDTDLDALDPRTGQVRACYAVAGLDHPRRVYDLAQGLLDRGYGERDIELVLGGNFSRALAQIWGTPEGPAPIVQAQVGRTAG